MRNILLIPLIFFFHPLLYSQGLNLRWTRSFGSPGADVGRDVTVDPAGNVYSVGYFSGTVDFDPGTNVFNLTSAGGADVYILKLDAAGNFIWAKRLGSQGAEIAYAMTLDPAGNIYFTGNFESTVDFDPGAGVFSLSATTTNAPPGFILKLDGDGNFQWAAKFDETRFDGLSIGLDGYLYGAGGFSGVTDFDPGTAEYKLTATGYTLFNPLQSDAVVLKLNLNGGFVWARSVGGVYQDYASCITADLTGKVYVMGSLELTGDLDPGAAINNFTTNGGWDVFFLSLDAIGNLLWAKTIGGPYSDFARTIVLDNSGNLLAAGSFYGSADLDPTSNVFTLQAPSTSGEVWVGKFTSSGGLVWAKNMGGSGEDFCAGLALDASGNVYTTGGYSAVGDFDPGTGVYQLSSNGHYDIFLSRLDHNGNFVSAKSIGSSVSFDAGFAIKVDGSQNIYTTGYYSGTVDFDPEAGVSNHTAVGATDVFVQKFSQCLNVSFATITTTACNAFTLNNVTYTASGTYTQTLINRVGCDSVLTLHLTIGGSSKSDTVVSCENYTWQGQTYSASGDYNIILVGAGGCDSILQLHLTIKNKAVKTIDTAMCEGQSYEGYTTSGTYINTFVSANGCDSIRTLNLVIKARSFSVVNAVICEGENYLGHTTSGTYKDTLVGSNGCDSIRALNLLVNPKKYASKNISVCQGQTYFAGGAIQTSSGIYHDTLTSIIGCDSIITTNLTVHQKPVPNLGQDRDLCEGAKLTLMPGTFASFQWHDGTTSSSLTVADTGTYWVSVLDINGCQGRDTITIRHFLPIPQNFLKTSDTLCQYDKLTLSAARNFQDYSWSNGSRQPSIVVSQPSIYTLTVTDDHGCVGKDTINIVQKQCATGLFVPTAFTPNGDGKNDVFQPRLYGQVKKYQLSVFNRWGGLVFQSIDLSKGWDGRIASQPQGNGVFVWTIVYQLIGDIERLEKGTLLLVR